MIGIEFTMKNGEKDYYDPVDYPKDFEETETQYILHMTYKYEINKSDVVGVRHYDLCPVCGYEVYQDGCHNDHDYFYD